MNDAIILGMVVLWLSGFSAGIQFTRWAVRRWGQ